MDWNAAIERNREALKRILASLVAMAGLDAAFTSPLWPGRAEGAGDPQANTPTRQSDDCRPPHKGEVGRLTLPRHLHRGVLRLLRPAESAARRLIIVMAREVVVTLPPQRPRRPKSKPTILRHRFGTGIIMPRGVLGPPPLTPPHKGEGDIEALAPSDIVSGKAVTPPSPLWGGIEGGGQTAHTPALPLLDPLRRRSGRARPTASAVPRISVPGFGTPAPVRRPPSPDDPISAARLAQRLQALAAALDDLRGQARRFARWRARRDLAVKTRRPHRFSPLRPGPAYGVRRPYSRRRAHKVDEVLRDVHYFACSALDRPDTS